MGDEYWICKTCHGRKTSPLGTYCTNCGDTFERFAKADELEKACEEVTESLTKECHRLDAQVRQLEDDKSEAVGLLNEVFGVIKDHNKQATFEIAVVNRDAVSKLRSYLSRIIQEASE